MSSFIRALLTPKAHLAARLLAAESQLAVHQLRIQQKREPKHPREKSTTLSEDAHFLRLEASTQRRRGAHVVPLKRPS